MTSELDRIIVVAIAAGFLSGSSQSIFDNILKSRAEQQAFTTKKFTIKFLYSSFAHSAILGAMIFVLAIWDTSLSIAKINRFSIAMAIFYAIMPFHDRLWSFIFSKLKKTS